jgi:energy-coupling factor transporter ATP-binding protein EcfA2
VETAPEALRAERAERLSRHVAEYLLPKARNLSAPLVVVLLGSTGAGKSSLFNAIAGRGMSPSGLLRPTTRRPLALAHPSDAALLAEGDLLAGMVARNSIDVVVDQQTPRGLVIVDAPDFDSVELSNRKLAMELLEAADLVIFVTTVTRYADQVPWSILARAHQRGVPLLAVINRMPTDETEAKAVLADYQALLERSDINKDGVFGRLEVVIVDEGALDRQRDALSNDAVRPILEAIQTLRSDDQERKALALRSFRGALSGLPAAVEELAREVDDEQRSAEALVSTAEAAFRNGRRALQEEIERGTFLRTEVLRQWLDFVQAGPLARFLSEGIGRFAASIRGLFRPSPRTPAGDVKQAAFSDLVVSAVQHADASARRTANVWVDDPYGAMALAKDATLWGASTDLAERLHQDLEAWTKEVGRQIRSMGEQRKGWAQAASIGLNVLGTSAILAVFVHTGGLTGAEVGISAATALINQKLLEAIFGEANVAKFVTAARVRLQAILDTSFAPEKQRFLNALAPLAAGSDLAAELRRAAHGSAQSSTIATEAP